MEKKRKTAAVVLLVLIGATLVLIWGHSLMPANQSKTESDTIRWLLSLFLGDGAVAAFLLKNIRKVGHFAEFFLLGGEISALRQLHKTPVMWLYGLGVAAIDESLQFAAPGRAPAVTDVLLDYCGYLCGFLLVLGVAAAAKSISRRRQK